MNISTQKPSPQLLAIKLLTYTYVAIAIYFSLQTYWGRQIENAANKIPPLPTVSELRTAVRENNIAGIKAAIAKGADVNELGGRPLKAAAYKGNAEAVALLLQAGAKANVIDPWDGGSILGHVAYKGYIKIMKMLVKAGADVNHQTKSEYGGDTPLTDALRAKKYQMANQLLELGANPNVFRYRQETPLHMIAYTNNVAMAKALVQHGANIQVRNKKGQTPADIAHGRWVMSKGRYKEMAEYLMNLQNQKLKQERKD